MNKEEKEAIEHLKVEREYAWDGDIIEIALNYIDKLQKENEELKEQRDNAIKLRNELIEEQKITCVSKNKIRDKIKELEEEQKSKKHISSSIGCANTTNYVNINNKREIKVLKELLGE